MIKKFGKAILLTQSKTSVAVPTYGMKEFKRQFEFAMNIFCNLHSRIVLHTYHSISTAPFFNFLAHTETKICKQDTNYGLKYIGKYLQYYSYNAIRYVLWVVLFVHEVQQIRILLNDTLKKMAPLVTSTDTGMSTTLE